MKRLLCIVGGMNVGGAETFLMKIYRRIDKTKYQMDFAVAVNGTYDAEIKALGGRIYKITPKSSGLVKNFNDIKKIVKRENYEYVLRTSQNSLSALELYAAKLGGAKVRVFRSSNSNTMSAGKDVILHKMCKFMPKRFANVRIAPSTEAAEFMFGKKSVSGGKASILNNGIDLNIYRYSESCRQEIREEFNISDRFVVGHVGRFNQQKNHKFLIEIFAEVLKLKENAVLMLVGKGELENEIKEQIADLGIVDKVIFTGVRSDIPSILSAMDVFVMPSFYEGMPNTVIEAQATGLPCVISDSITREANITGLVEYLPLGNSCDWAKKTLSLISEKRFDTKQHVVDNEYDIESVVDKFIRLVFDKQSGVKE